MHAPPSNLSHHIIVCLFSEADSPLIGLGSFIMPLRASNFHFNELKGVVLLGTLDCLRRVWVTIQNFPKIYVMPVSKFLLSSKIIVSLCNAYGEERFYCRWDPVVAFKSSVLKYPPHVFACSHFRVLL